MYLLKKFLSISVDTMEFTGEPQALLVEFSNGSVFMLGIDTVFCSKNR
jgi:hypothetical protein